jgi:hypothetical protein
MTKEFYIISFIFLFSNFFLAVKLNVISIVLNYKHISNSIINLKLGFSTTLKANCSNQHFIIYY